MTLFFQHVYEWNKVRPLNAIFVEIIWWPVAGSNQDDALVKQVGKQLLEDHCISNICHLDNFI